MRRRAFLAALVLLAASCVDPQTPALVDVAPERSAVTGPRTGPRVASRAGRSAARVRTPLPRNRSASDVAATLACIRRYESGGNYRAVNASDTAFGAYQFQIPTWDGLARRRRPRLVGVRPDRASVADQDQMAAWLLSERGLQPWPTPNRLCR